MGDTEDTRVPQKLYGGCIDHGIPGDERFSVTYDSAERDAVEDSLL